MLAFLAERLDSGFRTAPHAEEFLRQPVLSTIPELDESKGTSRAADRIVSKPMSQFAEAIRGLSLGLTLSRVDTPPKVIVVTSAVPGEGKTTVAITLARQSAVSGKKVLIIDGDLRHPTIPEAVGLPQPEIGILEALAGKVPVDECLLKDPLTAAMILPCAGKPSNPMDLLASNAMKQLLGKLKNYFDIIIIDSAPVLPVHDTKMMSQLADAFLFVIRWEKTPRDAALSAIRALVDVNAPVVGVVLTRANYDRFQYYSHGYQDREGYAKYYSE
jgi:capsular exopolysaccharide synthesis family protein